MKTVPVYEWLLADGKLIGCGTKLEMDYWTAEGVFVGYQLGKVLCQQPASEDERRKRAWGIA